MLRRSSGEETVRTGSRVGSLDVLIAIAAVFIALSGTAAAALVLTGRDVKDESITGADIRDGSIRAADLATAQPLAKRGSKKRKRHAKRDRARIRGERGDGGPTGSAGSQGPTGTAGPPFAGESEPGLVGPLGRTPVRWVGEVNFTSGRCGVLNQNEYNPRIEESRISFSFWLDKQACKLTLDSIPSGGVVDGATKWGTATLLRQPLKDAVKVTVDRGDEIGSEPYFLVRFFTASGAPASEGQATVVLYNSGEWS